MVKDQLFDLELSVNLISVLARFEFSSALALVCFFVSLTHLDVFWQLSHSHVELS